MSTPQTELKPELMPVYDKLYGDHSRLEEFMTGTKYESDARFAALAENFDFSKHKTHCDLGGATGNLSTQVARRHPHIHCLTFDLPKVEPLAKRHIEESGLSERVKVITGNFFEDTFPKADVMTMGMILHNWNLQNKLKLIQSAFDALPEGGALIAIEAFIDNARRENTFGLMMSLTMHMVFGDGFDYSYSDFKAWCFKIGFKKFEYLELVGPYGAAIAYK